MSGAILFDALERTGPYRRLKSRINRRLADFLCGHFPPGRAGLAVAELACGSGYATHLLAGHPSVRLGVCLDRQRATFDRERVAGFRARFVQGDLLSAPFRPGSFDLAWNSSALEHFPDPPAAVRSMAGLTRPGGLVFVGVPARSGPLSAYHLLPRGTLRDWLGRPYSLSALHGWFDAAGLRPRAHLRYFACCFVGLLGEKV